jgi:ParB family chromosome partitioning protein
MATRTTRAASTKKRTTKKRSSRKTASGKSRRPARSAKRLTPAQEARGLQGAEVLLGLDAADVAPLVREVEEVGGAAIGAYREPVSGRPLLLAVLPRTAVQPTPFQRDLSPTHTKRLAEKIEQITALLSPDEDLAFRILALNTEKAHNLKDRSLEVIRMARELARRRPRARESQFSAEFEAPELLTLGIVYERNKRFAGAAYRPFLRKVDRFSDRTLPTSLRQREDHASRLEEIEGWVKGIIEKLQRRGFKSPYLRTYVVARINPVRFHRAKKGDTTPPMTMAAALTRMATAAKRFDLESVKTGDLALVAAVAEE